MTQPQLTELFARYLQRRLTTGDFSEAPVGEVVPFDVGSSQPVDPRFAWDEAVAVARWYGSEPYKAPLDWATLVSAQESVVALPMCLGNFPQMMRDIQPLMNGVSLKALRPNPSRELAKPAHASDPLLMPALLRLAKRYEAAAEALKKSEANLARDNEQAALAGHRGDCQQAADMWRSQPDSVPVHFNRGMAALFLDQPKEARQHLQEAVTHLPEDSGWHHLARLYLTLAEMRA